jgi:Na+-transporting NADH:ubiquinone oxidoreductase subunit A
MIKVKLGMDLPIEGVPEQVIHDAAAADSVALLGPDYVGLRPTMLVAVGERVKLGQTLFLDKKNPGVCFTSPAAGTVAAIERGSKRALRSVIVKVDGDESETFSVYTAEQLESLDRDTVEETLLNSGLWTALRTRPYSKIPAPGSVPHSIFVAAMDSNPLAADPVVIIAEREQDFLSGLKVLSRLTEGKVHVCCAPAGGIPRLNGGRADYEEFDGPHPAGLVGTHIHFLDPVGKNRTVWHVGYQDVLAIGHLFTTGELKPERVIALGGPLAKRPRLLRTRIGADLDQLTADELNQGEHRIVSGSVFSGHIADGPKRFLGRYHHQVSVLLEDREREFIGWLKPGKDRYSVSRAYTAHLRPKQRLAMTTSTRGSPRAMVPVGFYERVMPLDILPTLLLRALITMDTDLAQDLGCLELDEEDLALCTFVCAGKYEYGPILRENLTKIEREG